MGIFWSLKFNQRSVFLDVALYSILCYFRSWYVQSLEYFAFAPRPEIYRQDIFMIVQHVLCGQFL